MYNSGLICVTLASSCQGSPYFATLLAALEENLRQTSGVRRVVPPKVNTLVDTSHSCLVRHKLSNTAT